MDEDEEDPLDAFMVDVGTAVKHDLEALDPVVAQDALEVNPALAKAGIKLELAAPDGSAAAAGIKEEPDEAPAPAREGPVAAVKEEDDKKGLVGAFPDSVRGRLPLAATIQHACASCLLSHSVL